MSDPFLSSDEYAERAHELYNGGYYEEAIRELGEAVARFPNSVELHLGLAYVHLALEEYAWARASFETALGLDPNNEEALAGLGESLLKLGDRSAALQCFDRVLALGFREDHDLMLQIGRALFREGMLRYARGFFEIAAEHHEKSAEAAASLGYAAHRLGDEDVSVFWLRHAIDLDEAHSEARIYLGNLLYDRGEYEGSLFHFEHTDPADHYDELALWRTIELKKSIYRLPSDDPELLVWQTRLADLAAGADPVDQLLTEVAATRPDGTMRDPQQIELFGTLLTELQGMQRRPATEVHRVKTAAGATYGGSWEEIVFQMKMDDRESSNRSLKEYMQQVALRSRMETGAVIPVTDAESFVQGVAEAGGLQILS
ncbi:MAG: tetratricopeptide repeat protein [Gemmatimonadota bacterium]|nr:tetratricopeptide repeat protein [Gemmatimonadota bacterium]